MKMCLKERGELSWIPESLLLTIQSSSFSEHPSLTHVLPFWWWISSYREIWRFLTQNWLPWRGFFIEITCKWPEWGGAGIFSALTHSPFWWTCHSLSKFPWVFLLVCHLGTRHRPQQPRLHWTLLSPALLMKTGSIILLSEYESTLQLWLSFCKLHPLPNSDHVCLPGVPSFTEKILLCWPLCSGPNCTRNQTLLPLQKCRVLLTIKRFDKFYIWQKSGIFTQARPLFKHKL